jgi:hypothetical protein
MDFAKHDFILGNAFRSKISFAITELLKSDHPFLEASIRTSPNANDRREQFRRLKRINAFLFFYYRQVMLFANESPETANRLLLCPPSLFLLSNSTPSTRRNCRLETCSFCQSRTIESLFHEVSKLLPNCPRQFLVQIVLKKHVDGSFEYCAAPEGRRHVSGERKNLQQMLREIAKELRCEGGLIANQVVAESGETPTSADDRFVASSVATNPILRVTLLATLDLSVLLDLADDLSTLDRRQETLRPTSLFPSLREAGLLDERLVVRESDARKNNLRKLLFGTFPKSEVGFSDSGLDGILVPSCPLGTPPNVAAMFNSITKDRRRYDRFGSWRGRERTKPRMSLGTNPKSISRHPQFRALYKQREAARQEAVDLAERCLNQIRPILDEIQKSSPRPFGRKKIKDVCENRGLQVSERTCRRIVKLLQRESR